MSGSFPASMMRSAQDMDWPCFCLIGVETLANGYIKSVPLPHVTARAAHVTTVTARRQALTPVPHGLAPVPLSSPMDKHEFSHESESFVQPLIM